MRKLAAAAFGLLSVGAVADQLKNAPAILFSLKNQHGGDMFFTSKQITCPDKTLWAFIRDPGGKTSLTGCYTIGGDMIFVQWSDDTAVYTYDFNTVTPTEETLRFLERAEKNGKGI